MREKIIKSPDLYLSVCVLLYRIVTSLVVVTIFDVVDALKHHSVNPYEQMLAFYKSERCRRSAFLR